MPYDGSVRVWDIREVGLGVGCDLPPGPCALLEALHHWGAGNTRGMRREMLSAGPGGHGRPTSQPRA